MLQYRSERIRKPTEMSNDMKKILKLAILVITMSLLCACGADECADDTAPTDDKPGSSVKMTAEVKAVGERIEVEVLESPYTSGPHWVITSIATEFIGKDGKKITKNDLKEGDKVEILYSGQVMMSYPPQIVAARITVLD